MKHAMKCWLRAIAACVCLTAPAWAQVEPLFGEFSTGDSLDTEASISLPGDYGAVRVGQDPSASAAPPPVSQRTSYVAPPPVFEPQAPPMFQQALIPADEGIGFASMSPLDRIRWRVGRVNMNQYGFSGGHTDLNAFIPLGFETSDRALWWFNPRGFITDHGRGAGSMGLGRRAYVPEEDRVYGASFWWDFDSGHRRTYHQMGGSFESIGRYMSLRGNFTLPVGTSATDIGIATGPARFVGSQIAVEQLIFSELALQQYDIEVATPMPVLGRYGFDVGVGAYVLNSSEVRTGGVSIRGQAQITEDFWLNGIYTYDDIFASSFSLNFELTVPDGRPSRWFRRKPVSEYLTESVYRRYRVPVAQTIRRESVIARDAAGRPINVAFIDPNRAIPGVGSREAPFMSVEEYMSLTVPERDIFGVIFVSPRLDNTDIDLNTTITLLDFQRLVGDTTLPDGTRPGISVFIGDRRETIALPSLIPPGIELDPPRLSNTAAPGRDVVTLAHNNEVAGFIIDASGTASGIVGTNIDGFNIHNVTVQNAIDGIRIRSNTTLLPGTPPANTGIIANNVIQAFETAEEGSQRGVSITHVAGTLDLLVMDNVITGMHGVDFTGIGMEVIADGGTINASDLTEGNLLGFFGNQITNNGTGLELVARNGGIFDVAMVGLDEPNRMNGNLNPDTAGFVGLAETGGVLTLDAVVNNRFNDNQGNGVFLIARNGGLLLVPAVEIPVENGENGDVPLPLAGFVGNFLQNNRNNGIQLLADNARIDAAIGSLNLGNNITDNGRMTTIANRVEVFGSGVLLSTLNGGVVNGRIDGNLIARNVEAGIKIAPDAGVVDLESISGNTIIDNGFFQGQPIPLDVLAGDAIVFAPSNGGTFRVGEFTGNIISGNRGAIIRVGGERGIIDLGVIENTIFDRTVAGTAGILFDADGATITGVLRGNTFLGSADNPDLGFGVGGVIRGGTLDLVFEDNLFDTNAGAGIGLIFSETDERLDPGTGTPLVGEAAEASLVIRNNAFVNTLLGTDERFDGAGISIQLEGQERDILLGQNDIVQDGNPDATPIPLPDGSDVTTRVHPAPIVEAIIAGNLIGASDITDLTNPAEGNAGPGIDIRVSGDSMIRDLASVGSTINRLELNGMLIDNNVIVHNYDGIRVRRRDSGVIDNFVIRNNVIQNNLNDGIDIVGRNNGIPFGVEEILDFTIVGNQILSNGFLADGTQGIAGRGITLRADAGVVLEANIAENLIAGNRLSGIEARTFTDTHIVGDVNSLRSWTISSDDSHNTIHSASGGDEGVIFGVWELNEIVDNGFIPRFDVDDDGNLIELPTGIDGHGIALGRIDLRDPDKTGGIARRVALYQRTQLIEGFNNGGMLIPDRNGDGLPELPVLTIQDNLISDNALDGIHMYFDKEAVVIFNRVFSTVAGEVRTSRVDVLRNDILNNGDDGLNVHNPLGSNAIINFHNNFVTGNGLMSEVLQANQAGGNVVNRVGDGIEIVTAGFAQTTFNANENRIKHNAGRGVNIFTGAGNIDPGDAYLIANFNRNNISSNGREGFYLLNAPLNVRVLSTTRAIGEPGPPHSYTAGSWLADFDSNHEIFNWGFLQPGAGNAAPARIDPFLDGTGANIRLARPVTDLVFTSNIVDNNGGVVPDSDPGDPPFSTIGGFVMRVGTATGGDGSDPSFPRPGFTGGVRALIQDNRFSGNFGRDVYMDGFVATQPPRVDVMPDPLVRIDLQFRNNRGGSIDVSELNFNVFYVNTAPGTPNVKRPNPPFTPGRGGTSNPRDATRNFGLDPFSGLGPFPGFGQPTLRIESDGSNPDPFGNFLGNNEFNLIYSSFDPGSWLSVPVGTLFP